MGNEKFPHQLGDTEMRSGDPEIRSGDPEIRAGNPKISSRDPEMSPCNPGLTLINARSGSEKERLVFKIKKLTKSVL